AVGAARSREAKVLVDDDDLVARPAQLRSPGAQGVLPLGGLLVVLDLGGGRLPHVHDRLTLEVEQCHLAVLRHRTPPPSPPAPGGERALPRPRRGRPRATTPSRDRRG